MSIEVQKVLVHKGYIDDTTVPQLMVPSYSRTGRLLRFLFRPAVLRPWPVRAWGFAERLAKHPPDLVTHLGLVRSNAYFDAGCPLALCDHAAARDLWRVIHEDAIAGQDREGQCH